MRMRRRSFLRLAGLGAVTVALGSFGAFNMSESFSPRKVDFHAHPILPSYVDGLKRLDIDAQTEEGFPLPKWTVDAHLKFMDEAGIDFTVLSMPTPHIYNSAVGEKVACDVARKINNELYELCRIYPDRFGFVAVLPTPSVEGSVDEIRYTMSTLGALGVKVASNSDGVYLGDERLDPIFKELDARRALVIMHPSPAPALPRIDVVTGKVMALFEYPADTTRAVLNLLANKTLDRYSEIKFVVPHCGSFLPYMKQRAEAMFRMLAGMGMMKPTEVAEGFKKMYFDLAGDPMPEEMDILLKITDENHLVYGSDYPYVPAQILLDKKKALDEALNDRDLSRKIYSENAEKLLGVMS